MERFTDWKGREVAVRYSRRARVPYLLDWRDNVIGLVAVAAPPPFLTRHARHYVARRDLFETLYLGISARRAVTRDQTS